MTDTVRCFLSYAHQDDADFGVVQPFVGALKAFFEAHSGREIVIFVDRESIGWGDDWRSEIDSSVERALIFMPLVSRRYFTRDACREELVAFEAKSSILGVSELLLPVAFMGTGFMSSDSEDEAVRLIGSRQYEDITAAYLEGPGSAEWRKAFFSLAKRLKSALDRAELRLAELEVNLADDAPSAPGPADDSHRGPDGLVEPAPDFEEDEDLLTLIQRMNSTIAGMTEHALALAPAITDLGNVAQSFEQPSNPNPKNMSIALTRIAKRFEDPAQRLQLNGDRLLAETATLDSILRTLWKFGSGDDIPEVRRMVRVGVDNILEKMTSIENVNESLGGLLESFKTPEALNVSLRRALKPARRGIRSVRSSLDITESWRSLRSDGSEDPAVAT